MVVCFMTILCLLFSIIVITIDSCLSPSDVSKHLDFLWLKTWNLLQCKREMYGQIQCLIKFRRHSLVTTAWLYFCSRTLQIVGWTVNLTVWSKHNPPSEANWEIYNWRSCQRRINLLVVKEAVHTVLSTLAPNKPYKVISATLLSKTLAWQPHVENIV